MAKTNRENSLITKMQSISFKKRKECILKKTMELSVLCDTQACAVIVDDDGEITTWPEDQTEVVKLLEKYYLDDHHQSNNNYNNSNNEIQIQQQQPDVVGVSTPMSADPLEWNPDDDELLDLLKKPWNEILNDIGNGVDGVGVGTSGINNNNNGDDYQSLIEKVDEKLKSVTEKINEIMLKSANIVGVGCSSISNSDSTKVSAATMTTSPAIDYPDNDTPGVVQVLPNTVEWDYSVIEEEGDLLMKKPWDEMLYNNYGYGYGYGGYGGDILGDFMNI